MFYMPMFCLERSSKGKAFVFILYFASPAKVAPLQMQRSHAVKQLKGAALLTEDFHLDPISMFIQTMQAGKLEKLGQGLVFLDHYLYSFLCTIFTAYMCALSHIQCTPLHTAFLPKATLGNGDSSAAYTYKVSMHGKAGLVPILPKRNAQAGTEGSPLEIKMGHIFCPGLRYAYHLAYS